MHMGYSRRKIIVSSIATSLIAPGSESAAAATKQASWVMSQGIPDRHVRPATKWLLNNFGPTLKAKLDSTAISLALSCAIACQESAYTWYDNAHFTAGRSPDEMMRLLILDNVQTRGAFPRGTSAFKHDSRLGGLAARLIAASDASRKARGYSATGNLLYGYGLFQYDLQNIVTDAAFWRTTLPGAAAPGMWADVGACADRLAAKLGGCIQHHPGDLKAAIAAYNGRGPNARAYAEIVTKFSDLAAAEIG